MELMDAIHFPACSSGASAAPQTFTLPVEGLHNLIIRVRVFYRKSIIYTPFEVHPLEWKKLSLLVLFIVSN